MSTHLPDFERDLVRLKATVGEETHLYSGTWTAMSADGSRVAMVASTDANAARAALRLVFPWQLCVVPVELSGARLAAAVARVREARPDWAVRVAPELNRVLVQLPVLDQASLAIIGDDAAVIRVQPMLERA